MIVSRHLGNADVFSIARDGDLAYINYLMVENGTIVQTHTTQVETHLEETDEEVLAFAIAQLRETFNSLAREIILPFPDRISRRKGSYRRYRRAAIKRNCWSCPKKM